MKSEKGKAAINFHTIFSSCTDNEKANERMRERERASEGVREGRGSRTRRKIEKEANKMLKKLNKSFAIHSYMQQNVCFPPQLLALTFALFCASEREREKQRSRERERKS